MDVAVSLLGILAGSWGVTSLPLKYVMGGFYSTCMAEYEEEVDYGSDLSDFQMIWKVPGGCDGLSSAGKSLVPTRMEDIPPRMSVLFPEAHPNPSALPSLWISLTVGQVWI
jgi:hypothetical protein